jgi:membrane protease YdiL (CAAX protease family)
LSTLPLVSILIELNYKVAFPNWLGELETYFKEMEDAARKLNGPLLTFNSLGDLVIAIIVIALIPGFAEEYFFRGLVQGQLQNVLKNHHYAILLSAFLFSLMHFQFYGLVPRIALGVLFGYMFTWSNNIWYPIIAHMMNNSVGVLSSYFWGPTVLDPESGNRLPIILLLISGVVCYLTISYLRKNYVKAQGAASSAPS